jgi:hypothetical protein
MGYGMYLMEEQAASFDLVPLASKAVCCVEHKLCLPILVRQLKHLYVNTHTTHRDYAQLVVNGKEFTKFRSPGNFPLSLIYLVLKADRDLFLKWLAAVDLPVPTQRGELVENDVHSV